MARRRGADPPGDGGAQPRCREAARIHDLYDGHGTAVQEGPAQRRREGKTDLYKPTLTREEYLSRRAQSEIEVLIDRYGDVAFSHFAKHVAELDPERRRALERLADEQ